MSTEEQQAIKNERRRIRDAQRRQNMSEQERLLHNERRRNEYRANQQITRNDNQQVIPNESRQEVTCKDQDMLTEEQQVIKNEMRRIHAAQRRHNMTEHERMLHNERRRNEYRANQQIPRNNSQQVIPNESHQEVTREDQGNMSNAEKQAIKNERRRFLYAQRRQQVILNESHQEVLPEDQRNMLTEEQQAIERERKRILEANRRQTMTDQEKNLRNERRRNQYRAMHHQGETRGPPSSSTSNAPTNLFEHVIHEHVQAEVERLIGRVKTVAINTSKGYMELGPQHRAPLHTSFEDMLEFDGLINELENDPDNRQEDLHEVPLQALQPTHGNINRRRGTHVPNRGFHNCAREFVDLHSLPPLQLSGIRPCNHCGAKLFPHETSAFCCLNGKVTLPGLPVPPELMELYTEQSEDATHFRQHIRSYNHVFSFTSIGVHIDNNLANCKKGVYTYRAQGTMYHKIGSLIPEPSNRPRFLQMYIYDTEHELENRLKEQQFAAKNIDTGREHEPPAEPLKRRVLGILKTMLDRCNPYVRVIRQLAQANDLHGVRLHIKEQPTHRRQYNMPTSPQVAAILVGGEDPSEVNPRDIIIETTSGQLLNVPDTACFYDPLQYPLLLPFGSFGWDLTIFTDNARRISCRAYYSYLLQIRENQDSILLRAGKLLQQYAVDNYVKISTMQLRWVRDHQKTFRAEWYTGVLDAVNANTNDIGHRVILPPTYTGSPRDMHQRFHDAMALVQKYGKPDFFITMTCNPNWEEIKKELYPGQHAHDRPDLTTRVFHSKFEEMKRDLFIEGVLGKVVAHVHVIEFQKRGLPHAHILIIIDERDKLRGPVDYDGIVRAELPDPDVEPGLYAAVLKHMVHMPCILSPNSVCMKNGMCKKKFPKPFAPETREGDDSYPVYRRRNDGRQVELHNGKVVNNTWVVPYNPWLLKKYDCHINVEVCSSIKSVKYLYKYVWKGVDRVSMEVSSEKEVEDEIKQFVDARWICPQESLWRIYKFQMNKIHPPVVSLQVHLEDKQTILLPEGQAIMDVLQRENIAHTKLTAFFRKNREDEFARTLLYKEFPEHYTWNKSLKQWQRRQRNHRVIGRVSIVSIRSDTYNLRLLLNHVRGPTSFEDLLKVGANRVATYKEAAQQLGLLESDTAIRDTLLEAVQVQMPSSLRRLFCMLLIYCSPSGVQELWDEFLPHMIEDHLRSNSTDGSINLLLREISSTIGPNLMSEYDFPETIEDEGNSRKNYLVEEEKSIPVSLEDLASVDNLNNDQRRAFERIVDSVYQNQSSIFFIDGPGGSGKTFLYRAILAFLRSQGHIAIATATSGIAATMMPGGRTAHSRFKIPVPAESTSTCNIGLRDDLADLIRKSSLIIWDEATMANRHAFEALDRTLRDLMQVELPFGGKLLVLGGDFRQVLPVIQNGDRAQTINACLTSSIFWKYVNVIQLKENMRARLDPHFSEFLLRIGDGTEKYVIDDMVKLPDDILLHWDGEQSVRRLIDDIFPKLEENAFDSVYMSQRALITPRNDIVEKLNQKVVEIFPGSEVVYQSFDSVVNDTNHLWTEDFLNSIAPGGLPPHKLILKIGTPIMLLRNLDPKNGLCNGTRLLCRRLLKNSIDAEIFSGSCSGMRVLIPRIPLEPSNDTKLPFKFVRKQFPVRASFALTINKSQGQTIPNVGIYLPDHVFSHGQLYVALSRGVSRNTTKVLVSHGLLPEFAGTYTRNVVFQDILRLCAPSAEDSLRGAEPEITGHYASNVRNKGKQKIQEPVFTAEGSTSCLTSSHENSSRGSTFLQISNFTHHCNSPHKQKASSFIGRAKHVHIILVLLNDGTEVPYGLLVWSTGVGPSPFINSLTLPKSPGGRVGVDEWLRVPSVEDVYSIGDCSGFLESTGKPTLPALAQVAERQGKYLAYLLNKVGKDGGGRANSTKDMALGNPFVHKHMGSMATIGRYKALVDLRQSKEGKGLSMAGFVSWFVWRSAYLTRVISWRNRFYVAINWLTTLLFGRDISRI